MKVLNFGSLNLDYIYQTDHFVQPGETLSALSQAVKPGGKGLNQSIALARALGTTGPLKRGEGSGAGTDGLQGGTEESSDADGLRPGAIEVFHAGCLGQGGSMLKQLLDENGVNTEYLLPVEELQGNAVIQVVPSGQNCILLFGGSNQCVTEEQIGRTLSAFSAGDFLVLQNEVNSLPSIISKAHEIGMKIMLNPSPCNDRLKEVDFAKLTWLAVNEVEAEQLTGSSDPGEAWRRLHALYPRLSLLVTLGEAGSVAWQVHVPEAAGPGTDPFLTECAIQEAFPVQAADTTGAGDTYTGYFIAALLEGYPLKECMKRAAMASAISVTRPGAASSVPRRSEVDPALK